MVTLAGDVIRRYERFSLYNSPYPAHDHGRAVDLYPGNGRGAAAPSPVAGEVVDTQTVRVPHRHYAVDTDHLLLVDTGEYVARILHVNPAVDPGEDVAIGDPLGSLVRSGFFGQWVDDHLHVGFRRPDQHLRRASGSLPLDLAVDVTPLAWDGYGTVVETGPTHALLDAPANDSGEFAALASDEGIPLDGGLPHYTSGGTLRAYDGPVSLLGTHIGTATDGNVTWADVAIHATRDDGERILATGLSLFASQVVLGAKLVFHEGHEIEVGETVRVNIDPTADRLVLG